MRNVKTPQEILLIEKACKITDDALVYILPIIKPGVTEKQIASEIMRYIRKSGASLSFRPIVAFGKNSVEPHHKSNNLILRTGDIVLLDLGAKLNGYCSDITRTVFMGKATDEQKKMYLTVLKAQEKAIEFLSTHYSSREDPEFVKGDKSRSQLKQFSSSNNNIFAKKVDKIARDYIISQGYPDIPHGLGHGIGKRVHEGPRLSPKGKRKLFSGMVFSVEPGIYIKDFGGIRIEDLMVLEKTGPRIITRFTKQIIEL